MALTVEQRAASYNAAYPMYPPLVTWGRWLYGIWEIGNNYRNTTPLYGAYPPGYLDRLAAIFPDYPRSTWWHVFAGSLPPEESRRRIDVNPDRSPDLLADAQRLSNHLTLGAMDFVAADPPYSEEDAVNYDTPMPNRHKVMRELAYTVAPGGQLAWLDTVKPMYRAAEWHLWGEIGIARSTNHRVRFVFLFERKPYAEEIIEWPLMA